MYYGSYSLPTYETVWNAEAFLLTTVVPVLIMLVVNLLRTAAKAASVSAEIPAQGSVWKETETSHCGLSPRYQDFFQIPAESHFSEYEQLSGALYRHFVCQSAADVWTACFHLALAHYQTEIQEQYAGQLPVYAAGPGECHDSGSKLEELLNLADVLCGSADR